MIIKRDDSLDGPPDKFHEIVSTDYNPDDGNFIAVRSDYLDILDKLIKLRTRYLHLAHQSTTVALAKYIAINLLAMGALILITFHIPQAWIAFSLIIAWLALSCTYHYRIATLLGIKAMISTAGTPAQQDAHVYTLAMAKINAYTLRKKAPYVRLCIAHSDLRNVTTSVLADDITDKFIKDFLKSENDPGYRHMGKTFESIYLTLGVFALCTDATARVQKIVADMFAYQISRENACQQLVDLIPAYEEQISDFAHQSMRGAS